MTIAVLIFCIVLIVGFGAFGFLRGVAKEGIRTAAWIVLFAVACLFLPAATKAGFHIIVDAVEVTAENPEQLVAKLLYKTKVLEKDTYLIVPGAIWLRSALMPVLTAVFLWISWLLSGIFYFVGKLIVSSGVKKTQPKAENEPIGNTAMDTTEQLEIELIREAEMEQMEEPKKELTSEAKKETAGGTSEEPGMKLYLRIAGMLVGIVMALLAGAITTTPLLWAGEVVNEAEVEDALGRSVDVSVPKLGYKGTATQAVYRYTGMEFFAGKLHSSLVGAVVPEGRSSLWDELPVVAAMGTKVYGIVDCFDEPGSLAGLDGKLVPFLEDYFSLKSITEEQKLLLLNHMKDQMGDAVDSGTGINRLSDWMVVQDRQQVLSDVEAYGKLIKILAEKNLLNGLTDEQKILKLQENDINEVMAEFYKVSNVDVIGAEMFNYLFGYEHKGEKKNIIQEGTLFDEAMKPEVSEVVDVLCATYEILDRDSLTPEDKQEALNTVRKLRDNKAVGRENYASLLQYVIDSIVGV